MVAWQGLELEHAFSNGGPDTSCTSRDVTGATPVPAVAISIPVPEPTATYHLETDAAAGVAQQAGACARRVFA